MMQTMQDQMSKPKEYTRPSCKQHHRYNNNYEGKRNFDQWPSVDRPKQSNIVREEGPIPKREECSYFRNLEEEEVSPVDDCVHMLTEEDIDALFSAQEIQPFTMSKKGLQQIIEHSIKVAQRDVERILVPCLSRMRSLVKNTINNTI